MTLLWEFVGLLWNNIFPAYKPCEAQWLETASARCDRHRGINSLGIKTGVAGPSQSGRLTYFLDCISTLGYFNTCIGVGALYLVTEMSKLRFEAEHRLQKILPGNKHLLTSGEGKRRIPSERVWKAVLTPSATLSKHSYICVHAIYCERTEIRCLGVAGIRV